MNGRAHKPEWLKIKLPQNGSFQQVDFQLKGRLNTICRSACCPNLFECWQSRHATFLLMGDICTRNCLFCNVRHGFPKTPPDTTEIEQIIAFTRRNNLSYLVLTSVTRDDLPDGGANYFRWAIDQIKENCPEIKIEALIPDFNADQRSLELINQSSVDLVSHNLETVKELYPVINRTTERYRINLNVLSFFAEKKKLIKSGFMVGLGENWEQIEALLSDLKFVGVKIVTIGQYLQPRKDNLPVSRFYSLEEFAKLKNLAESMGLIAVSGPLVRSSYRAFELYGKALDEISNLQ